MNTMLIELLKQKLAEYNEKLDDHIVTDGIRDRIANPEYVPTSDEIIMLEHVPCSYTNDYRFLVKATEKELSLYV